MITSKDFFLALDDLEKEKKIDKEFFISALETALVSAYKKNFGEARSAEVKLNPEKGTIKVLAYKTIVEDVTDSDKEISLADAKAIKSTYKIGDVVAEEVTPKSFGRIAAQTAKQVVMQKLREMERDNLNAEINSKGGEQQLVTAKVLRKDESKYYLSLGNNMSLEGVLGKNDLIPGESFEIGSYVKVLIRRAYETAFGGVELQVTRTLPNFVKKLFEVEVPEIASGDIEIKAIAREPGNRTKISVLSKNPNIDALGTCVGAHGARINAILQELGGEKVDIIKYTEDDFEYIKNALSPAEVISVELNQETKSSRVIVPDNKLSLAIGKEGCNARLAAKLTGWKIDVKSESNVEKEEQNKVIQEVTPNFDDDSFNTDIFEDIEGI